VKERKKHVIVRQAKGKKRDFPTWGSSIILVTCYIIIFLVGLKRLVDIVDNKN